MSLVDLGDLFAGESSDKAHGALGRYAITAASSVDDPAFDAGYRLMHGYFGEKGEIERRAVLEGWAAAPEREIDGLRIHYQLLVVRDADGGVVAARDHYAVLDPAAGLCVVYLAHSFVVPEHRRTGVAALLRTAPATLGRRVLAEAGLPDAPLILAVEQEPLNPADPDSVVRLAAYGRAGYRAVDPAALPYCQPDFRDLEALGLAPAPIPLLAMVRPVGSERRPTLPAAHAAAFLTHLYAVFSSHCRPADLLPARQHALSALARAGDPVRLFEPPRQPSELPSDSPLHRASVLAHHLSFS